VFALSFMALEECGEPTASVACRGQWLRAHPEIVALWALLGLRLVTISVTFMVMKRAARYSVAEAKAHLSEVVRRTREAPAVIHNRGRDVAVVLSIGDYQRLRQRAGVSPVHRWLADLASWHKRTGGADFEPETLRLEPQPVDFGGEK
jgi:prevent-host-death family protein